MPSKTSALTDRQRIIVFGVLLVGSIIGLVASIVLSHEALTIAKDSSKVLGCDLNAAMSCSYRLLPKFFSRIDIANVDFYFWFLNVFEAVCNHIGVMGIGGRIDDKSFVIIFLQSVDDFSLYIGLEK